MLRRKLSIYVANEKPFPNGSRFVAHWQTEDPRNSLIDPFFYEHAARGDIESHIWIARLPSGYTWDFFSRHTCDQRLKAFMLEIDETRWFDLQAFWAQCWEAIEKKPKRAFQKTFK